MGASKHPTVQPPTKEEQETTQCSTALELLRCLDEDWEYMTEAERRQEVRNTKRVLNND